MDHELEPSGTHLRTWSGRVVSAVSVGTAVFLCVRAPTVPEKPLPSSQAARVAAGIAGRESSMRRAAERHFPGDAWSQGDDYHNQEQGLIRGAAQREHVAIGSVIQALDDYLRQHPDGAHVNTAPRCKPRPFYD